MSQKQQTVLNNLGKSLGSAGDKLLAQLENEGFAVVSASDPTKAVEKALEVVPDLFLLNPKKRRLDGNSFLRQLKRKPKLAAVPAIFITKKASPAEIAESLDAGAHDYITAPFKNDVIVARIRRHITLAAKRSPKDGQSEKLVGMLNSLPALLVDVDLDGRIYDLRSPQKDLAYTISSGRRAKTIWALFPKHAALSFMDAVGQVYATRQRTAVTCFSETKKKSGWLEFAVVPKADSQSDERFIVLVYDITARKTAERERTNLQKILRQQEKMEGIGRLAGGISHDMNNLLGVIMGLSSAMRVDLGLDSPAQDDIEQLIAACRRGYELTSQLSSLGNDVNYVRDRLSLNAMIEDVQELLNQAISDQITIKTDLDPDGAECLGDPIMINHILINLALNAADAMPDKGRLTFTTKKYVIGDRGIEDYPDLPAGRYIMLEVSDNGMGMSTEVRERAFEPFFTSKPEGVGSGLGLPVVYGIVKNHDGRIYIDSKPNQGTVVKVLLPAYLPEDEALAAQAESIGSVPPETVKVLVVDDEEMVLAVERRLLQKLGYSVIPARSGEEALEIYEQKKNEIAIVLLDLVLPTIDGTQVFRKLKELDPDVRVIFCTGCPDPARVKLLRKEGAKSVLNKPFDLDQLSEEMVNALL